MIQPTFAQDNSLKFGVKDGINLANFSWQNGAETDSDIKFGAGGIMLYPLSGHFNIQVELMYLQKGAKVNDIDNKNNHSNYNFAYISLPTLGRYNLGSGNLTPYIVAGPEFSFLLSAELEFPDGFLDPWVFAKYDVKDGRTVDINSEVKSLEIAFDVGAGILTNTGFTPVFWEFRYSLGLSNWLKDAGNNDTVRTRGIQLFVGMMF